MKKSIVVVSAILMIVFSSCAVDEGTAELEFIWIVLVSLAIIISLAFIGLVSYLGGNKKEVYEEREKSLNKAAQDFVSSAEVTGIDNHYKFIVDDVEKQIIYIEASSDKKIIPFSKIMGVVMVEDNTMISSRSLGRTIGGALIGDLVAGGAGMIVGGLSGNSKQKKKVSKIEVIIKLRDFSNTSLRIGCLSAQREAGCNEINPEGSFYKEIYAQGLNDAIKITELVNIVIDQIDNINDIKNQSPNNNSNSSTADELQNSQISRPRA